MANSTIIYACTEDGLFMFNKPGTLPEWLPPRMSLVVRAVLAAWAEPGPPIRVVAAVRAPEEGLEGMGGELLLSDNGGRDWTVRLDAPVTSLIGISGADDAPATLYAGMAAGGMAGSVDGGETWGILPAFQYAGSVLSILPDSAEAGRFYVLLDLGDGETALLDGKLTPGEWTLETHEWRRQSIEGVLSVCQDPTMGDLYAAASDGVYMSADKGDTWMHLPSAPSGGGAITAIPSPGDASPTLIVGASSGLYASADGGLWEQIALPHNGGVTALARDPERRDRLYAATADGYVFESGDRGRTWQAVNAAPVAPVRYLYVLRI